MKKINSFLDISLMKYIVPFCGIIMPGLEKVVYYPRITMKVLYGSAYFALFFLTAFATVNYASIAFGPKEDLSVYIYYIVMATNAVSAICRISVLLFYREELKDVMKQVNQNFSKSLQSNMRQKQAIKYTKYINPLFLANIVLQALLTLYLAPATPITTGHELHPSIIPGDRNDPRVIFGFVLFDYCMGVPYVLSANAFEWSLIAFVRFTTIEMEAISQQLAAIFSSMRYDENYKPEIRKHLSISRLNDTSNTTYDQVGWLSVHEHCDYYKEKIKVLDQALNECISHHVQNIKFSRKIRKIYGINITFTYAYTVVLSTSIHFASEIAWIIPFAVFALMTLYLDSYCGEACVSAGCSVTRTALGMDWHLYPVKMQKKLLLMLRISQKPLHMDFKGIGPLCMASYSATLQFIYSISSFLATK